MSNSLQSSTTELRGRMLLKFNRNWVASSFRHLGKSPSKHKEIRAAKQIKNLFGTTFMSI